MSSSCKYVGMLPVLLVLGLLSTQSIAAETNATLDWVRTVQLSTAVSGVIKQVHVKKGDRVSADQALLNLEAKAFEADLEAKKAALKKAENHDRETERELERNQELYDRTLLSDHDLQLAKIARDAGAAELQEARAALARAEHDFHYSVVRAPFDAWVLQRNAQPGQTVVVKLQAEPLLVLAEAGRMLARSTVDGVTAGKLKLGQRAKVSLAGVGDKFAGKVYYIAMEPEKPGKEAYVVDVVFKTGDRVLRVGQPAKVTF